MAHLEVWKGKKLITRREVDAEKAAKGLRVRLGSKGRTHIRLGESRTLGSYRVELIADGPDNPSQTEAVSRLEFSEAGQSVGTPASGEVPQIEGYAILDELGHGGMGIVWRAVQLSTKRHVALKLLGIRSFMSNKARARFAREVALAARLTHPNISRVYDSGLYKGVYYYAMELVEGMPLDRYVREAGLNYEGTLLLTQKICEAMAHAHSRGIVHRDLKPSNILVTSDGEPHILDFGLAKVRESAPGDVTISIEGEVAGTPGYMSPEQAAGKTALVDERSDVYSLGVILYRLLTGQMPQDPSGSPYEMMKRRVEEEVIPPRQAAPHIDCDLEYLLLKALAREPAERYRSMSDLGEDIGRYLSGESLSAKRSSVLHLLRKKVRLHPEYAKAIVAVLVFAVAVLIIGRYFFRWLDVWIDRKVPQTVVLNGPVLSAEKEARTSYDRLMIAKQDGQRNTIERELRNLDTVHRNTEFVRTHKREIEAVRQWLSQNSQRTVPGRYENRTPQEYKYRSRPQTR